MTSDAGLLAYRELDDALGLTALAGGVLADSRTGRNGWHGIVSLLRQSVYGRLAGYEDVNDADRLGRDPAMRWIVGGKAVERGGASTSQMGRFETELLANNENLSYAGNTSRTIASSYPMPKRAAEQHAPKDRILKRENAEKVVTAARDFEGPLGVRVEDKRQRPPRLHDLPSLQKLCSARFGWPASKTLEVAQELYDGAGKKILTYPRAEVRYLPERAIGDVLKSRISSSRLHAIARVGVLTRPGHRLNRTEYPVPLSDFPFCRSPGRQFRR